MKLPDFSTFKPLEENRERMKAKKSEDSFVKIDERLSPKDLEAQQAREVETAAPKPPAAAPAKTAKTITSAEARAAAGNRASGPAPKGYVAYYELYTKRNLIRIVVIIQLVVMVNVAIGYALYQHFASDEVKEFMIIGTTKNALGKDVPEPIAERQK